jgi:anti-anti-sigma factor
MDSANHESPSGEPAATPGTPQFVRTRWNGGMLTVRPVGPVVSQREAPIVAEEVRNVIRRNEALLKCLVIDLSQVTMLGSMGLGMCIDIRNIALRLGAKSVLYGLRPEIAELFRMMRVERLYTIAKSADELKRLAA